VQAEVEQVAQILVLEPQGQLILEAAAGEEELLAALVMETAALAVQASLLSKSPTRLLRHSLVV
jgi:hypothetical protein